MKKILAAVVLVMFVCAAAAFAQSSSNAPIEVKSYNGGFIGIGYVHEALAVRVALNDLLSLEGSFGFKSGDDEEKYAAGGRALYILNQYNDFNVYGFGGLEIGYTNHGKNDDSSTTTFGIRLGAGVEYFLARNLSISAEMGLGADFEDGWHMVSTFGDWMSVFGFRYYLD